GVRVPTKPAPLIVIALAALAKQVLAASTRPEAIVTVPVNVLAPEKVSRLLLPPPSSLVSPWAARVSGPVPVMIEAIVVTFPVPAPRPDVSIVPPDKPTLRNRPAPTAVIDPLPVNCSV